MIVLSEDKATIQLIDACSLAEAETLQQYLATNPTAVVDWSDCTDAHTAIIQVLLAAKPRILGSPQNEFLRVYILELLAPVVD